MWVGEPAAAHIDDLPCLVCQHRRANFPLNRRLRELLRGVVLLASSALHKEFSLVEAGRDYERTVLRQQNGLLLVNSLELLRATVLQRVEDWDFCV